MQYSVATNLHYLSILFYNKSKVGRFCNSRFVLIHALRLHCWVHTKECRFFSLLDWFDFIFAVTDGTWLPRFFIWMLTCDDHSLFLTFWPKLDFQKFHETRFFTETLLKFARNLFLWEIFWSKLPFKLDLT